MSSAILPPAAADAVEELWRLVRTGEAIDTTHLWDVLAKIGRHGDDEDERTRLLIKQMREALAKHFGEAFVRYRLGPDVRFTAEDAAQFLDGRGFHHLEDRVQDVTNPETLFALLRDLGTRVREPVTLIIGGSLSLMLDSLVVRKTDDVDITDEVPRAIREDPALIDEMERKHGLRIAHFQSHYLPNNWANRTKAIGQFGTIDARRVDPVDVLVAKLFSKRARDFRDLRAALSRIDRESIVDRVRHNTRDLQSDPFALEAAKHNWYVLTGEDALPST